MLALDGVEVLRGGRRILDGVSLALRPGEVLALLGPNGAGKSTMIRVLSGEQPPEGGRVTLEGRLLGDWSAAELALRRAVLPQQSRLVFGFSVGEVVGLGRSAHAGRPTQREDATAIAAALAAADAARFLRRDYRRLSGGEQQRVQFARALAQLWSASPGEARFLLLDEPVASLDLSHQQAILQAARQLARSQRMGVLASLHDPNLAAAYADRIVLLTEGRVVADGSPAEVLTPAVMEPVFRLPLLLLQHPEDHRPVLLPATGRTLA